MSNWSSVIIAWSGIDESTGTDASRSNAIVAKFDKDPFSNKLFWHLSPSCGQGSLGSACQVVVLAHCNHFDSAGMIKTLQSFPWEYPDQVELMWKDEEADCYETWRMGEDGS